MRGLGRWSWIRGGALLAPVALAGACGGRPADLPPAEVPPSTAEAISFLGDTLWSVPLSLEAAQRRLARLQRARQSLADRPDDVNARLGVARHTAGMGRLREAIGLLTEALDRHAGDPRLYRLRGELQLQTRRPNAAIADLQRAAQLSFSDSLAAEFVEVDGVGLVGIGLRHAIFLLLGQAFFLKADLPRAIAALTEALERARNADEAAAAVTWLILAHGRASPGQSDRQALAGLLAAWRPDAEVVLRVPEHRLLLAWKGVLPLDSLRASVREFADPDEEALYTFAAGVARLAAGHPEEAAALFEVVRAIGAWTTMPYLAAEAELSRLRRRAARPGRA